MGLQIKQTGISLMTMLIAAALSLCIAPSAFAASNFDQEPNASVTELVQESPDEDPSNGSEDAEPSNNSSNNNSEASDSEESDASINLLDTPLSFSESENGVWASAAISIENVEGSLSLSPESSINFAAFAAEGEELETLVAGQEFYLAYLGTEPLEDTFSITFDLTRSDGTILNAHLDCTAQPDTDTSSETGETPNEDEPDGSESANKIASTGSNASEATSATGSSNSAKPGKSHSGSSSSSAKGSSKGSFKGSSSSSGSSKKSGASNSTKPSGHSSKGSSSGKAKSTSGSAEGALEEQSSKHGSKEKPSSNTDADERVGEQSTTTNEPDDSPSIQADEEQAPANTDEDAARLAILSTTVAAMGLTGAYTARYKS